ncbi:uncharacterized protein BDR25DRAFT_229081 [Lindgomyces ingoldianus]|uniref:Uncharacterized protein n=1 Tax=Lindgomyces ingoldianus TaxID=673940 RepID=A0ACB6QQN0_9PLEO|nr:uncharacterized protein BDR25DRAFT_229081 [Lindgomyces ingoldianus]KAF2469299.1 hypothetical protein BDR25DRAFT_229081 [Lindgomyces ingoldianus]
MRSLPTPHRAPSPNDIFTDYVSPLLSLSDRRAIISFEQWSSELDPYFEVTKIAEASFGEVYRLTVKSAMPNSPSESVLKIMAMRSPPDAPLPSNRDEGKRTRRKADAVQEKKREKAAREEKDQWKSYVDQIQSEVQLLQNLNPIPGFTNFRELTVLKGRPSLSFSNAWRTWNRSRPRSKKSVFPDPSKKTSYDDTQLWAVVEMQDAGTDCERLMERGGISTIWEVWDVFWGVCLSVAKAEEGCRFEHRDLHLENVCIRSSQSIDDISSPVVKNPLKRKLGFTSLETTVIDYTLSRADIINTAEPHIRRPGSSSSLSSRCSSLSRSSSDEESFPGPSVAYFDLNKDVSIFSADASEEYQYEIYRYMRSIAFYDDPTVQVEDPLSNDKNDIEELEEYSFETPRCSPRKNPRKIPRKTSEGRGGSEPPKDIWKQFHPKTNLVWIHFILYKLLQHINDNLPSAIDTVRLIKNVNIDASSASVASLVHKKAVKLERILQRVANRIEPCVLGKPECLGSVGELVVLAIQKGWVDMGDVVGSG